ncbi:unnamed protein product, partial [Adineta steineri]
MELIGYGTDDNSNETETFDQIKMQQYSTQSVDRVYRLASSSLVLVQLNSPIKSDRLWPFSEQILNKFNLSNLS